MMQFNGIPADESVEAGSCVSWIELIDVMDWRFAAVDRAKEGGIMGNMSAALL